MKRAEKQWANRGKDWCKETVRKMKVKEQEEEKRKEQYVESNARRDQKIQ